MTVHVTLSLAEAQKAELERLASRENISIEVLLARLVEQQLEEWRQVDEELAGAQADFAAGRFVDHAVVVAESEARYRTAEPE
jgi:predicted transcriptional regulator